MRGLGCGFAVAVAVALFGGRPAHAQQVVEFGRIESVGGFVRYHDKASFLVELRAGRIARGLVMVERREHYGPPSLIMTGQIDAGRALRLWALLYRAAPWRLPQVRDFSGNVDFPDTHVTYAGRYTQEILAGWASPPPGIPLVSAEMDRFRQEAWAAASDVAASNLFIYHAFGGRMGYDRTITISQDGHIRDEVTFASPAGQPYVKDGMLTSSEVIALTGLCQGWTRYPRAFPGDPRLTDGIAEEATYVRFGFARTIFGGDPASRPAAFQAVLDYVTAKADSIP
jgi:hypothetical protein